MPNQSYLQPETLAKLAGLELKARGIVEGYLAGLHRSPQRGFSVEFAEHREYVPGDDLRYVDWKVYGKRDRVYLKQFEEETNFVCYLLLDVSDSMRYRSESPGAPLSKLEYAKHVAAALAYLVLRQQDAVGLSLFDTSVRETVRPAGQAGQLRQVIHVLESIPDEAGPSRPAGAGGEASGMERALHELAERIHHRSLVVILSDFFADAARLLSALRHFRHSRHDVSVMQVVDPAEQDFPFDEPTLFHDLELPQSEFVDPRGVREAYRNEFERFRRLLASECRNSGLDYLLLRTDRSLDVALSAYLVRRARRAAGAAVNG
jgi:uncharacterized protein (DUF58 family)